MKAGFVSTFDLRGILEVVDMTTRLVKFFVHLVKRFGFGKMGRQKKSPELEHLLQMEEVALRMQG